METPPRPSLSAYLLLLLPPFFWSTNFIIAKALIGTVPPWTLNAGRFAISALILAPFFLTQRGWKRIPKNKIGMLVLMSFAGVFAFNSVLYTGLRYTSAINGTLVNATTPTTAALLSYLLIGEPFTFRRAVGIGLSFLGIYWIVSRGSIEFLWHMNFNPGDLLVLLASFFWSFYSVMAKPMMRVLSPFLLTSITTFIGVAFLVPVSLFEMSQSSVDLSRFEILSAFLYLGIFPSLIAFLAWNRSIQVFGPGRATLVYNTLPIFAIILSILFLGESLQAYQMIGGLIAISGVIVGTTEGKLQR